MQVLIDRDELYNHLENAKWEHDFKDGHAPWNLGVKVQTIANSPTIIPISREMYEQVKFERDVLQEFHDGIVRCKDCEYYEVQTCYKHHICGMKENDFCSYGERK